MDLLKTLLKQTEKIDLLFPNSFEELMNNNYYDYDKFEWFLNYVFKLEGYNVQKIGRKGRGDGGADLIINMPLENGGARIIGIQAKYWKNRVGTEPINQLASAKARHHLTDLWIITTSDLTSDAKEIAESMDIKILRGEDVKSLIEAVKKRYAKDITEKGESPIEFLKPGAKTVASKPLEKEPILKNLNKNHIELMRTLRMELSKKHKLFPVYNVYNNETMYQIIENKPLNLEDLSKIKGFNEKKINTIGFDVINFVKENLLEKNTSSLDVDKELLNLLLTERPKIAKFNNLSEKDVYDDRVAGYLVKMKPRNKETLARVYEFRKENIDIFGDYLIRVISKFLDDNNK